MGYGVRYDPQQRQRRGMVEQGEFPMSIVVPSVESRLSGIGNVDLFRRMVSPQAAT